MTWLVSIFYFVRLTSSTQFKLCSLRYLPLAGYLIQLTAIGCPLRSHVCGCLVVIPFQYFQVLCISCVPCVIFEWNFQFIFSEALFTFTTIAADSLSVVVTARDSKIKSIIFRSFTRRFIYFVCWWWWLISPMISYLCITSVLDTGEWNFEVLVWATLHKIEQIGNTGITPVCVCVEVQCSWPPIVAL